MQSILHTVGSVPAWLTYLLLAVIVFSEAALFVGFVIPGETAAVFGGFLAYNGHLTLWVTLLVIIAAAIIGDSVGYEVGRHFGSRVMRLRPLRKHETRLEQAKAFLDRRGGWALVLGRWTAFLRAVLPALAGTTRMHYPHFLAFNALGGVTWGAVTVLAGYLAGNSYELVAKRMGVASAIILGVVVVVGVLIWHRRRAAPHQGAG